MLLSHLKNKPLEERILETLHRGTFDGPTLLETLRKKDPTLSKETFYRILRKLLREEVVSKYLKYYSLNHNWLQRLYRFGKQHIEESDELLSFKEGDRIVYSFKNPNLMGIYWAHIYDTIFDHHDPNDPVLVFHPHEWLIHTRTSAESFFLNRFEDDKKPVFFALGGATPLDASFKKTWSSKFRQIATGTSYGLGNNEYLNVLGDFIFKITTSKKFGNDLQAFFKKHSTLTPEALKELESLCNRNDRARMVFIRSKKEADSWRKRFNKHFFLPKLH